jgi:transcription initiation factor IIE alpha subunit
VHLEAALAVWQYCEDSARYIFGNQTSDKLANKILKLLREAGAIGLTKTEIHGLTKNTYDASRLNAALKTLFENRLARFETATHSDAKKPIERWYASDFVTPTAELTEFDRTHQTTSSANSDEKETFTPSGDNLFDASPEAISTKNDRAETPLYYTYHCWACETMVSNQDSRCPNCDQDLNEPPF